MWVMTSRRHRGTRESPPRVDFAIGGVKIAEIVMNQRATRWRFYLRLMLGAEAYDVRDHYESFGAALSDLHRLLSGPAPEGFETYIGEE